MSPRSTLISCGSSSSEDPRRTRPTPVRRSSPSTRRGRALGAARSPTGAARRRRMVGTSRRRIRGPSRRAAAGGRGRTRELSLTATATASKSGLSATTPGARHAVERVLDRELPAARIGRVQCEATAGRRRGRASARVVDRLEQARHERDLDAEPLAHSLTLSTSTWSGCRGEGHDHAAGARPLHRRRQIVGSAQDRQPLAPGRCGASKRVGIEEADRPQAVAGARRSGAGTGAPRPLRRRRSAWAWTAPASAPPGDGREQDDAGQREVDPGEQPQAERERDRVGTPRSVPAAMVSMVATDTTEKTYTAVSSAEPSSRSSGFAWVRRIRSVTAGRSPPSHRLALPPAPVRRTARPTRPGTRSTTSTAAEPRPVAGIDEAAVAPRRGRRRRGRARPRPCDQRAMRQPEASYPDIPIQTITRSRVPEDIRLCARLRSPTAVTRCPPVIMRLQDNTVGGKT